MVGSLQSSEQASSFDVHWSFQGKLFECSLEAVEQICYQAFLLIYLLKERRPEIVEKLGFIPCPDSSKPPDNVNNQCQLGSVEWNPGPAVFQWGETTAAVQSITVFCEVHGQESCSQLLYELLFVAAYEEKKWAAFLLSSEVRAVGTLPGRWQGWSRRVLLLGLQLGPHPNRLKWDTNVVCQKHGQGSCAQILP